MGVSFLTEPLMSQVFQKRRGNEVGLLNEKMMSISTEMAGELDEEDILDIKLALLKAVHEMKSASLKQLQAIGQRRVLADMMDARVSKAPKPFHHFLRATK